jgi:chemotaxis methyl-accepting protein methylase
MDKESVRLRWLPEEAEYTLEAILHYIDEVAQDLDLNSRYVFELREVVKASRDIYDYLARLENLDHVRQFRQDPSQASRGERGRSWLDAVTWERMNPFERTLTNLITAETKFLWSASKRDFSAIIELLPTLPSPRTALSVPCSIGYEAFSLAIASLLIGLDLKVLGVDRQLAIVERARSGIVFLVEDSTEPAGVRNYLSRDCTNGRFQVTTEVSERCQFIQGDVLAGELPQGPFSLVCCRNFLGHFRGENLEVALRNVVARVSPRGAILLDPYVLELAETAAIVRPYLESKGFRRVFPEAPFFAAPEWQPKEK